MLTITTKLLILKRREIMQEEKKKVRKQDKVAILSSGGYTAKFDKYGFCQILDQEDQSITDTNMYMKALEELSMAVPMFEHTLKNANVKSSTQKEGLLVYGDYAVKIDQDNSYQIFDQEGQPITDSNMHMKAIEKLSLVVPMFDQALKAKAIIKSPITATELAQGIQAKALSLGQQMSDSSYFVGYDEDRKSALFLFSENEESIKGKGLMTLVQAKEAFEGLELEYNGHKSLAFQGKKYSGVNKDERSEIAGQYFPYPVNTDGLYRLFSGAESGIIMNNFMRDDLEDPEKTAMFDLWQKVKEEATKQGSNWTNTTTQGISGVTIRNISHGKSSVACGDTFDCTSLTGWSIRLK